MRRRKSSFASPSGGCGRGGCSSRRGSIGGATARGTGEGEEEERGLVLRDARGQKGGLVLRDARHHSWMKRAAAAQSTGWMKRATAAPSSHVRDEFERGENKKAKSKDLT